MLLLLLVCFLKQNIFLVDCFQNMQKKKKIIINVTKRGVMSILGLLVGCRSITKKKKEKKKDNILLFLFFTTTVISRFSRQSERNRCVHTLCVHHFLAFLLARQAKRTERASCLSTRSRTFDPPADRPTDRPTSTSLLR